MATITGLGSRFDIDEIVCYVVGYSMIGVGMFQIEFNGCVFKFDTLAEARSFANGTLAITGVIVGVEETA